MEQSKRVNVQADFLSCMLREREYQNNRWGSEFDEKNTINDWITYIVSYLARCNTAFPFRARETKESLVKVATLAMAAYEQIELDEFGKRHYDDEGEK